MAKTTEYDDYNAWKAGRLDAAMFNIRWGHHPVDSPFNQTAEQQQAAAQAALRGGNNATYPLDDPVTGVDATGAKMKAAKDGKEFGYANPPFDPRIMSWNTGVVLKGSAVLRRGYIVQDKTYWKGTGQKQGYRCNFLYNPSTLSVDYQVNTSILPSVAQTDGQKAAQALLSNMQSVTFNLLFDRTYEVGSLVVDKVSAANQKLLNQGVYADIAALERICGIYRTSGSALGGQGPMLMIPATVVFGEMGRTAKPLSWFGFISGLGVDYTHFGTNMTPMRATVALTFSQLVKVNDKLVDAGVSGAPTADGTAVS